MLNMRDLQYFTVLADELSFSRAAERLGISQPTLSQTLQRLERSVGGRLIERTTRRSRLTPAGETLVEGARQLLADLVRLERTTQDAAAGRVGSIRVGSVNPAMRVLMPRILRAVRAETPEVEVTLHPSSSHTQLRLLVDGQLEAGILRGREAPAGLALEPLMNEPLYAAVPSQHPVARADVVELADLNGLDFVMAPRDRNPLFYDELIRLFSDARCSPRRILTADDMWAQLAMIAAGNGVAVLPFLFVDHSRDDVVFRPLGLDLDVPLAVVYAPGSPSAAVAAVLRAARAESAGLLDAEHRLDQPD
ncbi:LysR family transcriptional regulator [Actinoalloteichus hymeniacidonis]|nr:LysR family transcriptional regulator [Actinoalloteichus hymeniacidonis]MBB5908142.1 DNA-binding transcriptional LysR family regulator [Actinoalloteichus hymeniacidonis]